MLTASNCKSEATPKYEDFNEEDFLMVPGIVIKKTRTPIVGGRRWYEYNIYYAYNLDSDTVLVGKEMDVELAVSEGDGIYVLVHKEDENVSFLGRGRIVPSEEHIIENYLEKSKEQGVKYYGVQIE